MQILAIFIFILLMLCTGSGARENEGDLAVTIQPIGMDETRADILTRLVVDRTDIQKRIGGSRHRVLRADFGEQALGEVSKNEYQPTAPTRFRLQIYDYDRDRLLEVSGDADSRLPVTFRESDEQPQPTPEEFAEAVAILRQDRHFGQQGDEFWSPYEPMPALVDLRGFDPSVRQERIVSVGVMPKTGRFKHEIVGVNLGRGRVIRFSEGAPPTSLATPQACSPPDAGQAVTGRGVSGQATVTVTKNGETLWKFLVTRPSASSGEGGSGIDLRNIFYKGRRVLGQLHVPIVNVKYDLNRCGPFRDWQYSENSFQAEGTLLASGILKASSPPRTIFESGTDRGNFRGVAVYTDGPETILVTEVSAGWYRYKSEYRFHEDGSIQPRWGFSAVQDSCTCLAHTHHAYWRMDFDVGPGPENRIQVHDGTSWKNITRETRQRRGALVQRWRVLDSATGRGYEIIPGAEDGAATSYGKGDFWALRYANQQTDDSSVYTGTSINIDAFVNDESVRDTDVVVWYGTHFRHPHEEDRESLEVRGPTLRPHRW